MAISYVNKSAFASGTAGLTVGAVASVASGDLILLFVESANQAVTTPTGYTQLTSSPVSTGTAAAAGGVRLAAFYRFATGADTTTTVADTGDHTTAIKIALRGVDSVTPFDATPVSGIKTPASTAVSFPSITTASTNSWIVLATALDLDAASTATTGTLTNANLTSITERHDQTVTSGFGGGLFVATGVKATAGATGTTTGTVTSTVQVYLTIAIREEVDIGTLAATEIGDDTFAADGSVINSGDLAADETGSDTLTAAGEISTGGVSGAFAAAETGTDALNSVGDVVVKGTMSSQESGLDTLAASGDLPVGGAAAASEIGMDILAAAGKVSVKGTLAAVESGVDTLLGAGAEVVISSGALSATENSLDTLVSAGSVVISGTFGSEEVGADTLTADGPASIPSISGTCSAVEEADYLNGYVSPGYVGSGYIQPGWYGKVIISGSVAGAESGYDTTNQSVAAQVQSSGVTRLRRRAETPAVSARVASVATVLMPDVFVGSSAPGLVRQLTAAKTIAVEAPAATPFVEVVKSVRVESAAIPPSSVITSRTVVIPSTAVTVTACFGSVDVSAVICAPAAGALTMYRLGYSKTYGIVLPPKTIKNPTVEQLMAIAAWGR